MPSQEAAIAAVQFRVSHLPLHRSSVPLRFELIIGAVLAATIADGRRDLEGIPGTVYITL